jgi:hypothetical protein
LKKSKEGKKKSKSSSKSKKDDSPPSKQAPLPAPKSLEERRKEFQEQVERTKKMLSHSRDSSFAEGVTERSSQSNPANSPQKGDPSETPPRRSMSSPSPWRLLKEKHALASLKVIDALQEEVSELTAYREIDQQTIRDMRNLLLESKLRHEKETKALRKEIENLSNQLKKLQHGEEEKPHQDSEDALERGGEFEVKLLRRKLEKLTDYYEKYKLEMSTLTQNLTFENRKLKEENDALRTKLLQVEGEYPSQESRS